MTVWTFSIVFEAGESLTEGITAAADIMAYPEDVWPSGNPSKALREVHLNGTSNSASIDAVYQRPVSALATFPTAKRGEPMIAQRGDN